MCVCFYISVFQVEEEVVVEDPVMEVSLHISLKV